MSWRNFGDLLIATTMMRAVITLWTPLKKYSLLRPLGGWEEREGASEPARGVGAGWRGSSSSVRMGEAPHGHAWKCSADAQTD